MSFSTNILCVFCVVSILATCRNKHNLVDFTILEIVLLKRRVSIMKTRIFCS
jgi:hypothetical protein